MLVQHLHSFKFSHLSFLGVLTGLDQALNAFLDECEERVYSKDEGVEFLKLGIYLIRGEMIALLGKLILQELTLTNH